METLSDKKVSPWRCSREIRDTYVLCILYIISLLKGR